MSKATCRIDGCDGEHYAHGVCHKHYAAERRINGTPCATEGCGRSVVSRGLCGYHRRHANDAEAAPCTVEDCNAPGTKKGMCGSHYRKQARATWGPCTVEGCDTTIHAAGLCLTHYHRKRTRGTTDPLPPKPLRGPCPVDDCGGDVKAGGMCGKHYARHKRSTFGTCTIDDCESGATNRQGYCSMHYARLLAHGSTDARPRKKMDPICSVEGCETETRSRGYCATHWARWRKHGSTDLAEPLPTFYCRRCSTTQPRANYDAKNGCCTECGKKFLRERNLFRAYRVFASEADAQEAHQGHMCAICGLPSEESKRRLHVDHCHATGRMRGRLCSECNLGLGKFKDDPHILEIAAAYLRSYQEDGQTA